MEIFAPDVPEGYKPSSEESFMNPLQRAYFRQRLLQWKSDLLKDSSETIHHMQRKTQEPDFIDAACQEINESIELRARDRERKLINKIDEALQRIHEGSYGYCEETGDPISLRRLEARPIATLSLEAQERHERKERIYRKDSEEI